MTVAVKNMLSEDHLKPQSPQRRHAALQPLRRHGRCQRHDADPPARRQGLRRESRKRTELGWSSEHRDYVSDRRPVSAQAIMRPPASVFDTWPPRRRASVRRGLRQY